jgi:acyl-CoA thioester hydrolase
VPAVYEHLITVRPGEIDEQGHVSNVQYVAWMQDAAVAHSSAQGWTPQRYVDLRATWVVRSHFIEYLQPAFAGERVLVRTWVADFRKVTSLRKYRIIRPADGVVLATAETNWAFISRETGAPRRIPPEMAQSFQLVTDAEAAADAARPPQESHQA